MQPAWRVYAVSALVACVVAAATAFVTVRLVVPPAGHSPNAMTQEGVAEMPWGAALEVFYTAPYAAPPNLTFPEGLDQPRCHVAEQKAGSFKLIRDNIGFAGEPNAAKVKWKAEGQPVK